MTNEDFTMTIETYPLNSKEGQIEQRKYFDKNQTAIYLINDKGEYMIVCYGAKWELKK